MAIRNISLAPDMKLELTIDRLGAQGDGVAQTPDGPVYVPFTLPGERVRIEASGDRGTLDEVLEPSPLRAAPPCPHFGRCGGCAVQHLQPEAYLAWKREQVVAALRARGIEAEVEPVRPVAARSRRRTAFTLRRDGKGAQLCYHGRRSHELIAIEQCPVIDPRLSRLIPELGPLLAPVVKAKGGAELWLTACDNGVDVSIKGAAKAGPALLASLAAEAPALGVIRVTINGELLFSLAAPQVRLGGVAVSPPVGSFLQAVQAAEQELANLVVAGMGDAREAADLFAGLGAFTFPMARQARMTAVESDRQALAALNAACRGAVGVKPISTLGRDLFRDPLSARELKRFDMVALDPPRAGAAAQADGLARSAVPRIVVVSCNPAAFARDARTLIDGGYRLLRVAPVDQFLFSPHLELVAHFRRD
jgi:23S rRNA (uracil1939-C5)-methyltransferase